jgi:uncharacterized protein
MQNAVTWFEIPSTDLGRAIKFYNTVLGIQLREEVFNGIPHGMFPADEAAVGGALIFDPNVIPSDKGSVVYLDARGDLDGVLSRVQAAGGKVVLPKTSIGDPGHIAILIDTEGNRVGLHQFK